MEEFTLDFFANDRYKLLNILCINQVKMKEDFFIPLSQQELANIANFSKLKTNKILNELIELKLVEIYQGKKGKYSLTDKAYKILHLIQKLIYNLFKGVG